VRLRTAGLLFQVGILAGHGVAVRGLGVTAAGRLDDEPSRRATMSGDDHKVESLDRTVLRVGDADVPLTRDDVKAMRDALLEYLKGSDYQDRDALLGWTRGPAWIDTDGRVRIGPWLLGSDGKDLVLRYRELPGRHAGKAHRATLARKDGAWTVTGLVMERIRTRP
jgi:hypothetical protein